MVLTGPVFQNALSKAAMPFQQGRCYSLFGNLLQIRSSFPNSAAASSAVVLPPAPLVQKSFANEAKTLGFNSDKVGTFARLRCLTSVRTSKLLANFQDWSKKK